MISLTEAEMADLPWPGDELVLRVAGGDDRESFYRSGKQSVVDIEHVLSLIGRDMASYENILDFGCGCGRIMLWLEKVAASANLHGVDIDKRAVEYSQRTFPYASFKVNQPLPPLDYPDGYFDLVYNHSVFTHIDEEYQDAWLAELRRVTKPGGHLVLSVHGEEALRLYELHAKIPAGELSDVRRDLIEHGICFVKEDSWVGGPFPDFYHSTFHAPWYVFEHWGKVFDVRALLPRGSLGFQDFVLLERPADDAALRPVSVGDIRAGVASAAEQPPLGAKVTTPAHVAVQADVDVAPGARFGAASRLARRIALRGIGLYRDHQREVDRNIIESVERLQGETQAAMAGQEARISEMYNRLWHAVNRQGERINRLEADLWDAIGGRDGQPGGPGE